MDLDSKSSWISTAYFHGFEQHIFMDFDSKFSWISTAYFHGFRQQVFMDFDTVFLADTFLMDFENNLYGFRQHIIKVSTAFFHGFHCFFIDWQHKSCIQVSTTINFKVM